MKKNTNIEGRVTIDIERVVRDAICGYENTYCEVYKNTNDKKWLNNLVRRRMFAGKWLENNGYKSEPMCEPMKKAVEAMQKKGKRGLK